MCVRVALREGLQMRSENLVGYERLGGWKVGKKEKLGETFALLRRIGRAFEGFNAGFGIAICGS